MPVYRPYDGDPSPGARAREQMQRVSKWLSRPPSERAERRRQYREWERCVFPESFVIPRRNDGPQS
jgi:hypothetical protein